MLDIAILTSKEMLKGAERLQSGSALDIGNDGKTDSIPGERTVIDFVEPEKPAKTNDTGSHRRYAAMQRTMAAANGRKVDFGDNENFLSNFIGAAQCLRILGEKIMMFC